MPVTVSDTRGDHVFQHRNWTCMAESVYREQWAGIFNNECHFKNSEHVAPLLPYGASERNIIEDNSGIRFASTEELIHSLF